MNWYRLSNKGTYNIGPYHNLILLGCGEAGGCVYLDPATGHAVKQTKSKSEVARAKDLMGKDFVFFPHIYNVQPFENTWLIEREEIPSMPEETLNVLDTAQMALEEVDYDEDLFPEQLKKTMLQFGMDPETEFMYTYSMGRKLLDLIHSVEKMGGLPGEIRGENIGIRSGGQFVVRDADV